MSAQPGKECLFSKCRVSRMGQNPHFVSHGRKGKQMGICIYGERIISRKDENLIYSNVLHPLHRLPT